MTNGTNYQWTAKCEDSPSLRAEVKKKWTKYFIIVPKGEAS
jgi:hypothetical protein